MPTHGMVTGLQKKTEQPPRESKMEPGEPVRLTDDLLYLVNKKLAQRDKDYRNAKLEYKQRLLQSYPKEQKCFTEVTHRKSKIQLSEIGPGTATKLKPKVTIFRATPEKKKLYFTPLASTLRQLLLPT